MHALNVYTFLCTHAPCCCRYCGAQYSTDVKFYWGLAAPPPPNTTAMTNFNLRTSVGDATVCDPFFGFVQEHALLRALRGAEQHSKLKLGGVGAHPDNNKLKSDYARHPRRRTHLGEFLSPVPSVAGVRGVDLSAFEGALDRLPAAFTRKLAAAAARSIDGGGAQNITLIPCHVMTSRLRSQLTPLRNQSDFISAMQHTQAAVAQLQGVLPRINFQALGE